MDLSAARPWGSQRPKSSHPFMKNTYYGVEKAIIYTYVRPQYDVTEWYASVHAYTFTCGNSPALLVRARLFGTGAYGTKEGVALASYV